MTLFLGVVIIILSFLIMCFNTPKTMLFIITILALLVWEKANAADNSSNFRMAGCKNMELLLANNFPWPKDTTVTYHMGLCTGQINTALAFMSEIGCVPKTVTVGQFIIVMNKFLKDHPEKRNEDFNEMMAFVGLQMWPCKDASAKGEKF